MKPVNCITFADSCVCRRPDKASGSFGASYKARRKPEYGKALENIAVRAFDRPSVHDTHCTARNAGVRNNSRACHKGAVFYQPVFIDANNSAGGFLAENSSACIASPYGSVVFPYNAADNSVSYKMICDRQKGRIPSRRIRRIQSPGIQFAVLYRSVIFRDYSSDRTRSESVAELVFGEIVYIRNILSVAAIFDNGALLDQISYTCRRAAPD